MKLDTASASGPDLSQHGCQVCGRFGCYGFGDRWFCERHRAEWEAAGRVLRSGRPAAVSRPSNGSLL